LNQTPAELRNAAARQLIARGRFRQALDVLNEAIRLDPRLPDSYQNRAEVFDQMNLLPQAEADRRKFRELGGMVRPTEPDGPPPPSKTKIRRRPPAAIGIRYPAPKKRRAGLGAFTQTGLTAFAAIGLVAAAGIGIFIAISTLGDAINGDDNVEVPGGSATPAVTATPAPTDASGNTITPAPTATIVPTPEGLTDALNGSPLSFDSLQTAWAAKGITASAEKVDDSVTGTATTPVSVTLSKGDDEMHLAVLFYSDASGPVQDFDLGDAVTPNEGRSIPAGAVGWWHSNVVVIVLDQVDSIKPDAFDAFINLS
jgi:hypothetical protein